MERHRAALADAAIEEQLEVQTAFREQGARLQGVYDKKQRFEYEMAKRCADWPVLSFRHTAHQF